MLIRITAQMQVSVEVCPCILNTIQKIGIILNIDIYYWQTQYVVLQKNCNWLYVRTPLKLRGQVFPASEEILALHTCCLDCTWVLVMHDSDLGNRASRRYDDYCNLLRLLMFPLPRLRVLWYAPYFWRSYMSVEGCGRCGRSQPFHIYPLR